MIICSLFDSHNNTIIIVKRCKLDIWEPCIRQPNGHRFFGELTASECKLHVKTHHVILSLSFSLCQEKVINHDMTALGECIECFLDQHDLDRIVPIMKHIPEKDHIKACGEFFLEKVKTQKGDLLFHRRVFFRYVFPIDRSKLMKVWVSTFKVRVLLAYLDRHESTATSNVNEGFDWLEEIM